jgi:hypothetical protein
MAHPQEVPVRPLFPALALSVLLTLPARAEAPAPIAVQAFRISDVAQRLAALGHEVGQIVPIGEHEVLVVDYVPKQGVGSEWDDESRLVLYRWDGHLGFEREQFVTKAGKSVPGRVAGLVVKDLDGDGQPEIAVIGKDDATFHRNTTLVLRRDAGIGTPFEEVFRRKDHLAAFSIDGRGLTYTFEDPADHARRFERYALEAGAFKAR